jgi:hypothetical protein
MKYEAKEAEAAAEEGLPVKEKLVITRLHNFQVSRAKQLPTTDVRGHVLCGEARDQQPRVSLYAQV